MRLVFHHLVETPDSLEVGEVAGEIWLSEDDYELRFADEALGERVAEVIEADNLLLRTGGPGGSSRFEPAGFGSEAWVTALFERLQGRAFRLAGSVEG